MSALDLKGSICKKGPIPVLDGASLSVRLSGEGVDNRSGSSYSYLAIHRVGGEREFDSFSI